MAKNKQIPSNQMIAPVFQPKTRRHYIVKFDEISAFLVKKIELPALKPNAIGGLSSRMTAKLFLHCPINPAVEEQVQNAIKKQTNGKLENCVLQFIDPVGNIINEWTFNKTKIVAVNFSSPEYASGELMECIIHFCFQDISFE